MSQLRFSIVIPTFNYGRFLGRALDSALAQPGDDYEVVVVDDGSTDSTPQIAASYGSRIRYFRQNNSGVFAACRRGLNESRGNFLIYFDADDRLVPGTLALLRREIERNPDLGLIAGRHVNVTAAGRRLSPPLRLTRSRETNFRNFLLGRLEICTGAAAVRRDAVEFQLRYAGKLRVGMEAACVAHTLWHFDAVAINDVLLEVHDHTGRLRENLTEIRQAGDQLVDAVFHPDTLPPRAMRHREMFRGRLLRDRSRSYHKAGFHEEAVAFFRQALASDPVRTLADVRNVRRYLLSRAKLRFASPSLAVESRPSRERGVVEVSGRQLLWGHRRRLRKNAIEFLSRCRAFGDVVKLQLLRPTYLLSDLRDIQHVLVKHPEHFRRTGLQSGFRSVFGRGLFSSIGRRHMEQRRLLQPLLHRARLDGFVGPLRKTLAEMLPGWQAGQVVEINAAAMDFAIRAAARMILGIERATEAAELSGVIQECHARAVRNMQSFVPLSSRLPTRRNRILRAQNAKLDAVARRLVEEARATEVRDDLLSRLVHFRGADGTRLELQQIRDHVMSFFLAAYEPSGNAMTWILYLLAQHPQVQRTLQAEIDAHAADPTIDVQDQESAAAWRRPYTSQVISEALRLYPSTWLLTRRATQLSELPSGVSIPRGCDVCASPYLVHRDARFFDAAEEFRPERFAGGVTQQRAAGEYLPFGLGPTSCPGEHLARLQIAIAVDGILSRFDLEAVEGDAPQPRSANLFTMQPDRAIRLVLRARSAVGAADAERATQEFAVR